MSNVQQPNMVLPSESQLLQKYEVHFTSYEDIKKAIREHIESTGSEFTPKAVCKELPDAYIVEGRMNYVIKPISSTRFEVSSYFPSSPCRYGCSYWNYMEFLHESLCEHLDKNYEEKEKEEKEKEKEKEEKDKCEQCGKTEEDCITKGIMFDTGCLSIYAVDNRLLCPDCIPNDDFEEEEDDEERKKLSTPPTYKFRCECPDDYERIQAVCGEGMIDAKVIPQFINEIIPIPDLEVEFKSTLSYEQLLRKFDEVADAHIAFQTLMPIEEYTGERDYDRTANEVLGRDMTDESFYEYDDILFFNRRFRKIVDKWNRDSTGSDKDEKEEDPISNMNDAQITKHVELSGTCKESTMVYTGGAIIRYSYCNFTQWGIEDQTVSNITITRATFDQVTFTNYVFDNVIFEECVFRDIILNNTTFKNSKFIECELDSSIVPDESCEVINYNDDDNDENDYYEESDYEEEQHEEREEREEQSDIV